MVVDLMWDIEEIKIGNIRGSVVKAERVSDRVVVLHVYDGHKIHKVKIEVLS